MSRNGLRLNYMDAVQAAETAVLGVESAREAVRQLPVELQEGSGALHELDVALAACLRLLAEARLGPDPALGAGAGAMAAGFSESLH
jgi:hypothetical protein